VRLVILGGSASSTPELFDALAAWPSGWERRPDLTVVLVGRDVTKLELVARGCRARPVGPGAPVLVEIDTERRRALDGADVIVNQVRVGGLAARAFDESFPRDFGLPGEETMGPGGFANALRTVPALRATWADIAALAPTALIVNLTNPAGIVQQAAVAEWPLRIVSVCDSPVTFVAAIAARLGRPIAAVQRRYVGMNHLGWYFPESSNELRQLADLATGLGADEIRLHEALPAPYVRYYVHPDRILEAQRGMETRAQALQRLEAELLAGYRDGPAAELPRRGAVWYRLAVLPLIDAWLHGSDVPVLAGARNDGRLPGVPESVVLELPHLAPRPGQLVPVDPIVPTGIPASLLGQHGIYEALTVAALRQDADPDARLRALLANPLVRSYDQARALLGRIEQATVGGS
jgi:6-phospho-beta-glucosidase